MVLFVLRLWGGNVFDRYIVQNGDLILKLLFGDVMMVYKGLLQMIYFQ